MVVRKGKPHRLDLYSTGVLAGCNIKYLSYKMSVKAGKVNYDAQGASCSLSPSMTRITDPLN